MIIINNELSNQEAGALLQFLDRVTLTGIEEATVYTHLITKLQHIMTSGVEQQGENTTGGE